MVEGVDLALRGGDAVILRGANGAGKSTLLRTLAGLVPPAAGAVRYRLASGVETDAAGDAACLLGHADAATGALTVAENLAFWAGVYGGQDRRAAAVDALDLDDLSRRPATTLSAGQRRRFAMARLIVAGRPIWLLDEPTASLDAANRERIERVVADHCASGGAVLVATHEPFAVAGARDAFLAAA